MPNSKDAVRISSVGDPESVVSHETVATASLPRGKIRVQMDAAPINPSDLMFIRGEYGIEANPPQSPGFEGVGRVVEANAGLFGRFLTGKRVVALHPDGGTWARSVTLPANRVIPIGESLSTEEAATFFVNPATAWVLCKELLKIPKGGVLLQTAGSSNLGRMIIRLGQQEAFRTVSVVRSESQAECLKRLGADHVIVFDADTDPADSLASQLNAVGLDRLIRHAVDPIGGPVVPALLTALANEARLILYGSLANSESAISARHLLTTSQTIEGFWLATWMAQQSLLKKLRLTRTLNRLHSEGIATTETYRSFPASECKAAVSAAQDVHNGEKVLLRFDRSSY